MFTPRTGFASMNALIRFTAATLSLEFGASAGHQIGDRFTASGNRKALARFHLPEQLGSLVFAS